MNANKLAAILIGALKEDERRHGNQPSTGVFLCGSKRKRQPDGSVRLELTFRGGMGSMATTKKTFTLVEVVES